MTRKSKDTRGLWLRCSSAIFVCAVALAAEGRSIRGRVIAPDGTGVAAIDVLALEINISRCCGAFATTRTATDGSFSFEVDPAVYVVWATPRPPLNPVGTRVDASSADISGLQLVPRTGRPAFLPDDPPRASLIGISSDGGDFATVRGEAGAVAVRSFVMFTTLETGDFSATEAGADGSFEARHFAPPGTSVFIKADPVGLVLSRTLFELEKGGEGNLAGTSGTIVRVVAAPGAGAVPVGGTGLFNDAQPRLRPTFSFRGTLNTLRLRHGDSLRLQGTIRSESPDWGKVESAQQSAGLLLELLSDASGDTRSRNAIFSSTFLTATGLPIEREAIFGDPGAFKEVTFSKTATDTLQTAVDLSTTIANDLPRGRYRAVLSLCCEDRIANLTTDRPKIMIDKLNVQRRSTVALAILEVDNPPVPLLHWTLLVDDLVGGARGVIALEDRGRYAVGSRIITESDTAIIPRLDARTGEAISYRLEPFALTVSVGDRGIPPSVPNIPFRLPSGFLRVEIRAPDGSIHRLGPHPFVQSRSRTLTNRQGTPLDQGGGHLTDAYQLSTMRPELEVRFAIDGEHVITLEGEIEDIWGNVWRGRGTYPILVAKPLVLDPAVLPGTPFEVGDSFSTGLALAPPAAADVEVRLRFVPRSDSTRTIERVFRGRANRTGHFHAPPFTFVEPGEYRVDVTAKYRDETGALWAGVKTSGGVIAPGNAALIAHGRRGVDNQPNRQKWFAHRSDGTGHLHIPWAKGDVAWQTKGDAALPIVTMEDPSNRVAALLRSRAAMPPQRFDERSGDGEIPLFSSRPDRREPHLDPAVVDLWAYSYRSIQRPLVRVREQIGEEVRSLYWRFHESYAGQPGVGSKGDLANDFKFQFGGAVVRGPAIAEPEYAIYGSLFVLIPDDDPVGSRVFPPFQGKSGGPSGGPLFKLKGRDIDIFLHPTGVRPGTVLQLGERAAFAGYSAPTLPSKIEIVVTGPSGSTRTVSGQANEIGYFHDPAQEFTVNETGIWKARVKILFDGRDSFGQVAAPFPWGDVLGSREGEFYFYVVDRDAEALKLRPMPHFVRPADGPVIFDIVPPPGLTNMQLTYTTTMPGFILEEGTTPLLAYVYDAQRLARDFPNLDLHDADGFAGVDIITISFLVSGTDPTGARKHFARQIVIQGEELQMPAQQPVPLQPRRRAIRR
jgi:hypothetical protein